MLSSEYGLTSLALFLSMRFSIMSCSYAHGFNTTHNTAHRTVKPQHANCTAHFTVHSLHLHLLCIPICTPQPDDLSLDPLPFGTLQSRVKGQLLLDPTSEESYHEDGTVLMAMMPTASLVSDAVQDPQTYERVSPAVLTAREKHCVQPFWLQTSVMVNVVPVLHCSSCLLLCWCDASCSMLAAFNRFVCRHTCL